MTISPRLVIATVVFLVVLSLELLLIAKIWPDIPYEQVNNFLLISMGLAFIPLILVAGLALAVLGILIFVAFGIASLFVPKKPVTLGEIAARKAAQENKNRFRKR